MALAVNSSPIEGKAMLMDVATNGVKKEVKIATINVYFLGEIDIHEHTPKKIIRLTKHNTFDGCLSFLSDKTIEKNRHHTIYQYIIQHTQTPYNISIHHLTHTQISSHIIGINWL